MSLIRVQDTPILISWLTDNEVLEQRAHTRNLPLYSSRTTLAMC